MTRSVLLALLFTAPITATAGEGYAAYIAGAEQVVAALQSGADPATQAAPLQDLADNANNLIEPFVERYPTCAAYLQAARALRSRWESMSLAQIEADYHHDGVLPAVADPRDRALCYQMKDLLVHPLTALRLLRETPVDRASVEHEIVEVVAHGKALQALTQP
jgi:hypothetical protein